MLEGYEKTGTSPYYDLYSDEDYWIIDAKKDITAPREDIIMQGETAAQYIPFKIERYIDGIDMSEKHFSIIWNSEAGESDSCIAVNSYRNDESVVFAWIVDGKITQNIGNLSFQIQGTGSNEKGEPYIYRSQIKTISIKKSLNADVIISEQPQLYNELMNYVSGVLDTISNAILGGAS